MGRRCKGYLRPLLLRLGIIPPDTEFNRRAEKYAKEAAQQAEGREAWRRRKDKALQPIGPSADRAERLAKFTKPYFSPHHPRARAVGTDDQIS